MNSTFPAVTAALSLFTVFLFQACFAKVHVVLLKPLPDSGGLKKDSDEYHSRLIQRHDAILRSLQNPPTKQSENHEKATSARKVYSFTTLLDGFSANLSQEQIAILKDHEEVASINESRVYKPLTTHSYSFLGLNSKGGPWTVTNGSNVIIALFDTGIWPEDPSFSDTGLGPVPKKFKGICQTGIGFTKKNCNRKIVGARFFGDSFALGYGTSLNSPLFPDYPSPRDSIGHGSHTSSTAAGGRVPNVSINGLQLGTAKGMAFGARIAVYKVCWGTDPKFSGCMEDDIIAAMEQAVKDRVDVFSLSLGSEPSYFYFDALAQASFKVVTQGIPCVFAAGNSGPDPQTVSNSAPWELTVGASTVDRSFISSAVLGNKKKFKGISVTGGTYPKNVFHPLVDASKANKLHSKNCYPNSLSTQFKGKIVICQLNYSLTSRIGTAREVQRVGGLGLILINEKDYGNSLINNLPSHFPIPGVHLNYVNGQEILKYAKSSKKPIAYITTRTTLLGNQSVEAPIVAGFSSIGPTIEYSNILKPDLIAPGHSIVAAWTKSKQDALYSNGEPSSFYIASGTSMACPHVAGLVALIKSKHPSWPPSWIYSALMTTASKVNNRGKLIRNSFGDLASPFDMGAGHVNPKMALDPGLVYGITVSEYEDFLCSRSGWSYCYYEPREIDLNLPSLALYDLFESVTTTRRLTLVGKPSTYQAQVIQPKGTSLKVSPKTLVFKKVGQSLTYKIIISLNLSSFTTPSDFMNEFTFGMIIWKDVGNVHSVAMNVAVRLGLSS